MKKLVLIAMLLSLSAQADDTGLCDKIEAIKKNSQQQLERFTLTQFSFENNAHDLAIIVHNVNLPAQIQRVTFNRGQEASSCYFKPLAFSQGGDWGWHMLWAEAGGGLFFARMDDEAWVSSTPKRLSKLVPINPQFLIKNQSITVTWQQVENGVKANMQAISSDEGRSWNIGVAPI